MMAKCLGQAGFLLEIQGKKIFIDPYACEIQIKNR